MLARNTVKMALPPRECVGICSHKGFLCIAFKQGDVWTYANKEWLRLPPVPEPGTTGDAISQIRQETPATVLMEEKLKS